MDDAKHSDDIDMLRRELFGRSIVSVAMIEDNRERIDEWGTYVQGQVVLDDGRVLKLAGNGPNCACSAGDYDLTRLNDMPINGITDVQLEIEEVDVDKYGEGEKVYRLFVLAQDDRIELATFEGDDGNGYYGTGFWFRIVEGES